jgi:HK97 gp10 family phage protein
VVKIRGVAEHKAHLRALAGPEMVQQVGAALLSAGEDLQTTAQLSITEGAVSGKGHVPSAPGEPPKNDTGLLANSIEAVQVAPLRVEVSSNAPYSRALEYGTSKMSERPFMRPALKKTQPIMREKIRRAVAKVARGGKVT